MEQLRADMMGGHGYTLLNPFQLEAASPTVTRGRSQRITAAASTFLASMLGLACVALFLRSSGDDKLLSDYRNLVHSQQSELLL